MQFNTIEFLARRKAQAEADHVKLVQKVDNTLLGYQLLNSCGFNTGEMSDWCVTYPKFMVADQKDFAKRPAVRPFQL